MEEMREVLHVGVHDLKPRPCEGFWALIPLEHRSSPGHTKVLNKVETIPHIKNFYDLYCRT